MSLGTGKEFGKVWRVSFKDVQTYNISNINFDLSKRLVLVKESLTIALQHFSSPHSKTIFHFKRSLLSKGKFIITHPAITFSKLTIETLEQGVKYYSKLTIKTPVLLTLSIFHILL